jgi:hypothetical protein
LKIAIGIITAERSIEMIMKAHKAMSGICDVDYLTYSSMRNLTDIYERNAHCFDGLIFSGRFPYSYIISRVGSVRKPHAYFELTDRDYYRAFAKMLHLFPGMDVSRVIMEKPFVGVDFEDIFGHKRPLFFDFVLDDQLAIESAYENTMRQALLLWRGGKIDLILTRLTNLAEPLKSAGIPHELLFPSEASMLDAFSSLCGKIESRRLLDFMTASGIVSSGKEEDGSLLASLEKFNGQNGMSFVIRQNGGFFELTTSNETLRDITEGYANCLLTNFLHEEIGPSVCVGWGLGMDIVSSQRNAMNAFRESKRSVAHHAYLVNDSGEQIGPLSSGKAVPLPSAPCSAADEAGRQLGISPSNLQRLMNVQEKRGVSMFSSADLAFYLNVTPRSASRILARLAEYGCAKVAWSSQPNSRGRPYKIYEVNYGELYSRLTKG